MASLAIKAHELGRTRSIALGIAVLWSSALIAGAFFVPAYSSAGSSGTGTATLVGENGMSALIPIMIPLVLTLAVASALWQRRHAPSAGPAAWTVTGLLAAFNVLALLSIGVFLLPVTVCLVVACAQHRSGTVVLGSS